MYLIYKVAYHIISENTDFDYGYTNVIEYIFGMILVLVIARIIDKIAYQISYRATGSLYTSDIIHGKSEGKNVHWGIRLILAIFVLLISATRLPEMITTPIVHGISVHFVDAYHAWLNDVAKAFLQSIYN